MTIKCHGIFHHDTNQNIHLQKFTLSHTHTHERTYTQKDPFENHGEYSGYPLEINPVLLIRVCHGEIPWYLTPCHEMEH